MNKKTISNYQDYKQATAWEKLSFVAQVKHDNDFIVELKTKVFGSYIDDKALIVKNQLQFVGVR